MELILQTNGWGAMFGVPCAVVDQYIKLATPSQIKVLLYLLRYPGMTIQTEQMAKALSIGTELVEEAMLFWQQTELFSVSESAAPMQPQPGPVDRAAADTVVSPIPAEKPTVTAAVQRSSSEVNLTPSEIAAELQKNSGMLELFRMAEQLIGEPLTHMQQRALLWQYEYLSIPGDIILTVLSYCWSLGKNSISYEEKLIYSWWNQGLTTMQQINDAIVQDQNSRSFYGLAARTLDMNRPPTAKQKEYFDRWQALKLPMDLIRYAYEKTVEQTDKLSMPYMNKILETWAAAGYQTREDVDTNDRLEQNSDTLKGRKSTSSRKKKGEIPESPMAEAYRSLIYNIDE
ncbi:MAG: DnaD domain protein [Ruminococcus sp.]|nr:DnaD domain protein [Ruminococcus sp.]